MRKRASRIHPDPSVLATATWWGWSASIPLLMTRFLFGRPEPILAAAVLCGVLLSVDWLRRRGGFSEMSIQIRLGYIGLLLAGLLPWMAWIHAVQLVGTTARVLGGYCLLGRILRMMPWNRVESLTWSRALSLILMAPGSGGLWRFGARDSVDGFMAIPCEIGRSARA